MSIALSVRTTLLMVFFAVAVVVLSLIPAGGGSAQTAPETHVIDAVDDGASRWEPANITVEAGDTVRWEFDRATMPHTVTSSSSNWQIREQREAGGAAVEYTFAEPGEYGFLCEFHSGMEGTVTVVDSGEPPQAPPSDSDFQQVTLAKGAGVLGEPMAIAVLPDRSVLSTARDGSVYLTTPDAKTTLAAKVPVYTHDEDGLQGIAIDPNFEQNGWVYLYYAPPLDTPTGDAPTTAEDPSAFESYEGYNQLSRFRFADGKLDLSTEQKILRVPQDRGICCHNGGEIDFDAEGNLYLSTGDDTNPFESDGYSPIDERPTRNPAFDAQRTSANTNDLRGKLLRIKVNEDGSYSIPEGNLFGLGGKYPDADPAKTRPEIYAMGFRNPFRFAVDKETGDVLLGDYGPDAGSADPDRGPGGIVEFNLIKEAGNYGWPYCTGDNNVPYNDYDFATGQPGPKFNCDAPVNESLRNTGLRELPPVEPAWIPYDNCSVPEFGCGSESPMGGPTYNYDPNLQSETKFPEYYDGKTFIYEWGRGWIKTVTENADGSPGTIEPFFDSMDLTRPMALEFGPEGSLYVLDYGGGFFFGDENSGLYRIDYVQGKRAPIAVAKGTPDSGLAPLEVQFSSEGSRDLDEGDGITKYEWDFRNDGTVDSTEANPTHTYTEKGDYTARLTVTDATGKTGTATVVITVGNTRPEVGIETPPNGGFFEYGDPVDFKVAAADPEDGQTDCSKVQVDTSLGHNDHSHGDQSFTGCEGAFTIPAAWEDETQYGFYVVTASYTDNGGAEGASPLTGTAQAILQPKTLQAEFFTAQKGTTTFNKGAAGGGRAVGDIHDGDWISFKPVNLLNIESVVYRVASAGQGGVVEVRAGSPDGQLLASTEVGPTGGWENFVTLEPTRVTDPGGTHELFFVFKKPAGSTSDAALFDVDTIEFQGKGVAATTRPEVEITSPTDGQRFDSGAGIDLTADASDAENNIAKVEFFADGQKIGEDAGAPYSFAWSNVPDGRYALSARATNDRGLSGTSEAIEITVGDIQVKEPWRTYASTEAEFLQFGDNRFVIDANGADTWTGNDEYGAIYQDGAAGERFVATVKVTGQENTNEWAKAGIMVKNDMTRAGASNGYATVAVTPSNSFIFQWDSDDDGFLDGNAQAGTTAYPGWLRLEREGSTFTGYYSTDGSTWQEIGSAEIPSAGDTQDIGIFSTSHTTSQTGRVEFEGFSLAVPQVKASATPTRGDVPLEVQFAAEANDPDATFEWDFGDGETASGRNVTHTYTEPGTYTAKVTATDVEGDASSDTVQITATAPCEQPAEPEEGYGMLFDGTAQSLEPWKMAGPGSFERDGCAIKSVGGLGLYWYSAEEFDAPYSLKLEWMKPGDDNSGVFVGFPDPGNDPWVAVNQGEEIQIDSTDVPEKTTGAIYNEQSADLAARDAALKPDGEWNEYEIVVEPTKIIVYLNGTKINEWTDDDPNVDLTTGYVGVQNHGSGDDVFLRNIRIKELPQQPADTTPPETTHETSYEDADGDGYNTAATVTLTAADNGGSGVASTEYRLDGGEWTAYAEPITAKEQGRHTLLYRSTDGAGNVEEPKTATLEIRGDACPDSDNRETAVIGEVDSRVENLDTGEGCTIEDRIRDEEEWASHGRFMRHVREVSRELREEGVIDRSEERALNRAAHRSDVGKPERPGPRPGAGWP